MPPPPHPVCPYAGEVYFKPYARLLSVMRKTETSVAQKTFRYCARPEQVLRKKSVPFPHSDNTPCRQPPARSQTSTHTENLYGIRNPYGQDGAMHIATTATTPQQKDRHRKPLYRNSSPHRNRPFRCGGKRGRPTLPTSSSGKHPGLHPALSSGRRQ